VGLDAAMVQATVQEMARQAIGVDDELFLDSALMDSGMDSLTAVSFRNGLQQQLGVKLPSSLMFDYPTMK
ncbi:pikAII, partial [Symbiodinium pilosum]